MIHVNKTKILNYFVIYLNTFFKLQIIFDLIYLAIF